MLKFLIIQTISKRSTMNVVAGPDSLAYFADIVWQLDNQTRANFQCLLGLDKKAGSRNIENR